ncbi:hypothetical protein ONZ51_g7586 [Trametes cubensis]|uniref:Uncharacterized protein n=1 Tax=Trametes cubensis TaxID=1111947 RepID=A0AAD7TSE9_9APHY|nr:hypothetical protein ONZ51_g7586 [Trametes cubensis]
MRARCKSRADGRASEDGDLGDVFLFGSSAHVLPRAVNSTKGEEGGHSTAFPSFLLPTTTTTTAHHRSPFASARRVVHVNRVRAGADPAVVRFDDGGSSDAPGMQRPLLTASVSLTLPLRHARNSTLRTARYVSRSPMCVLDIAHLGLLAQDILARYPGRPTRSRRIESAATT